MIQPTLPLPVSETVSPSSVGDVAATVRECFESDTAVYPLGGCTSLGFGLAPKKPGVGLDLRPLANVVDYPARDLTITVEAGVTMQALREVLAAERQRLPIEVPETAAATLGGVIATNFSGPSRFGHGTVRDYVIGISAVDGRGVAFKGGGRVVKNVAGYDFCKLLTGSLGTIGVITQVTLKLKPLPERQAFLVCAPRDLADAERLLAALVHSRTTPVAVELLAGAAWADDRAFASFTAAQRALPLFLAVGLEGTDAEVRWMTEQLSREWWELGVTSQETLLDQDAATLLGRLIEFPAVGSPPMALKASVVPSGVIPLLRTAWELDPACTIQSHAGNGTMFLHLSQLPAGGVTKGLIGKLQTAAAAAQGTIVVLSSTAGTEATHQSVWGTLSSPSSLLNSIKREFDPKNILNPDRFVFTA